MVAVARGRVQAGTVSTHGSTAVLPSVHHDRRPSVGSALARLHLERLLTLTSTSRVIVRIRFDLLGSFAVGDVLQVYPNARPVRRSPAHRVDQNILHLEVRC